VARDGGGAGPGQTDGSAGGAGDGIGDAAADDGGGSGSAADSAGEVGNSRGPATCDNQPAARATVLFRVPRSTDPAGNTDFYRLPFPNDIRKRNGKISLQGHPRPGVSPPLDFDVVDRYLRAIEADSTGFGTNQAIYLRFSRDPDLASLKQDGAIALVDISAGSPEYGHSKSLDWVAGTGRTAYLCDRWMAIRPSFGQPLRPGTTYAAIVRPIVRDTDGNTFAQDDDFAAMLAPEAPDDPDMAAAWTAYAPLRSYLGDTGASHTAADLAVAAVFTTEAVEQPLAAIQAAIVSGPAPTLSALVHCGEAGAVSPCDDGNTGAAHRRGCPSVPSGSFDEYQGTVSLPVFQQGTMAAGSRSTPAGRSASCVASRCVSRSPCPRGRRRPRDGRSWCTATERAARTDRPSSWGWLRTTRGAWLRVVRPFPWPPWATTASCTEPATAARRPRPTIWCTTSTTRAPHATTTCRLRPICWPCRVHSLVSTPRVSSSTAATWRCTDTRKAATRRRWLRPAMPAMAPR
jgi:hypothetical protein